MDKKISGNLNILRLKKIIKYPLRKAYEYILDLRSVYYLKKNYNKAPHDGKIKVGFIVQMPELWDKQSSVYIRMCGDTRFEPWLIIVPKYDFENSRIGDYSSEKNFFISNCLNQKYIVIYNDDKWEKINISEFDYLFFQRPYEHYLPSFLRSSNTVCYTKNCYIPYATPEEKDTIIYPVSFFRNIYIGFMEDIGAAQINIQKFKGNCDKGIQHFMGIGYPAFEKCMQINKKCEYARFLWTPRWSYDPVIGGSHFIEYYQQLSDYKWGETKLIVRPHPLMWDNFIKEGILNKTQVDNVISLWKQRDITLDNNQSIEITYEDTDVLISDRSSVIPLFFLTGKPIIYCPLECEYSTLFSTILPGLYIANTWEELSEYINLLSQHKDPLRSVRQAIIDENFDCNSTATENIINTIIDDYNKMEVGCANGSRDCKL